VAQVSSGPGGAATGPPERRRAVEGKENEMVWRTVALAGPLAALMVLVVAAPPGLAEPKDKAPGKAGKVDEDKRAWTKDFREDLRDLGPTGRNPYFILEPGYRLVLKKGDVKLTKTVLHETKTVDGVLTRVVEERETKKVKVTEVARNYYAISKRTNSVYYFGEDVDFYEDGKVVSHEGAWLSGVNGAKFGLMMPGTPLVGARYYQEVAPKVAVDRAEVLSTTEAVVTPAGAFKNCLKVEETNPLEPGTKEHKYYAPGVGLVLDDKLVLVEYGFVKKPKK
jgi:hypothetical protein